MPKVTLSEAQANLTMLIEKAQSGEEVAITKNGKPLVKLISVLEDARPIKRRIGGAKDIFKFIAGNSDAPLEDFKDYV